MHDGKQGMAIGTYILAKRAGKVKDIAMDKGKIVISLSPLNPWTGRTETVPFATSLEEMEGLQLQAYEALKQAETNYKDIQELKQDIFAVLAKSEEKPELKLLKKKK